MIFWGKSVNHLSLSPKSKSLFEHRDLHSLHSLRDLGQVFLWNEPASATGIACTSYNPIDCHSPYQTACSLEAIDGKYDAKSQSNFGHVLLSARVTSHNT